MSTLDVALLVLVVHGALGAFDTLYCHEWQARLPKQPWAGPELGLHALDLGSGYLLHGTPYKASIGTAVTHGCIRLHDEDIEWLHDMIPVGAKVYIF